MKQEIAQFMEQRLTCKKVKVEHQRPIGLLQPLLIPERKWKNIVIDFVSGFLKTNNGFDSVWVMVDRLVKSAHLLAIQIGMSLENLIELYVDQIMRRYVIQVTIVSD